MNEPIFHSDLTMEQIEKNFEGVAFFDGLAAGLQAAAPGTISHKRTVAE